MITSFHCRSARDWPPRRYLQADHARCWHQGGQRVKYPERNPIIVSWGLPSSRRLPPFPPSRWKEPTHEPSKFSWSGRRLRQWTRKSARARMVRCVLCPSWRKGMEKELNVQHISLICKTRLSWVCALIRLHSKNHFNSSLLQLQDRDSRDFKVTKYNLLSSDRSCVPSRCEHLCF